jgi:hypothetical protein
MKTETKKIEVHGDTLDVTYDIDFNSAKPTRSTKEEWEIDVQSVNGLHWSHIKRDYLEDVENAILWHEYKAMQEKAQIKIDAIENEAWDEHYQNV